MLKTIEKKKKQIEEFTSNKTVTKQKKPINDVLLAKELKTPTKNNRNDSSLSKDQHVKTKSQESPKRSIVRGKILYDHAMTTLEKQYIYIKII